MSRVITNTNIIVDDFTFCKSFPKGTFIHFLTHYHSDHYEGLSALWDYGPIHCTPQTYKFITHNFPKIKNIHPHDYQEECVLEVQPGLLVRFWMFDAKHIPGSAMILFQGYMGTILFTGDFRYNFSIVTENPVLFPPARREGSKKTEIEAMTGISVHIDEMIFDNTYCNASFKFETAEKISKLMISIIERNKSKKLVYIAMGALGKHKILSEIAAHFQTNIIVSPKQYRKIELAGLATHFLTTHLDEGYIQLISKKNRQRIVNETKQTEIGDNFICIDTDFLMLEHQSPDQINYIVPYSLHSNFSEMETFIRMIKPSILRRLVIPYTKLRKVKLKMKVDHRLKFAKYLDFLEKKVYKSQSGYAYLIRNYTEIYSLTQDFHQWFHPEKQQALKKRLKVGDQNHKLRKRPVSFEEDDSQSKKSKKSSLKSIADSFNASNRNLTLSKSFSQYSRSVMSKKCEDFLGQYAQELSQTKTLPPNSKQDQTEDFSDDDYSL